MNSSSVRSNRWAVPARARVRVRLGPYVVVGRVGRVAPRAIGPPAAAFAWGVVIVGGRVGYGAVGTDDRVEYWRPLRSLS